MSFDPNQIKRHGRNIRNSYTRFPEAERRQKEAILRQEAYDQLTVVQKIQNLDERLGKGIGAKKERAKLQHQLELKKTSEPYRKTKAKAWKPKS